MNNTFIKWIFLSILFITINELSNYLLNFNELIYSSLSEKLSSDQIQHFFDIQKKWRWISYVFTPIYVLFKVTIISSVIYIGVFLFRINNLNFNNVWRIVLNAEFIFLLVPVFKIIWFAFFQREYDFQDIQNFYPFSALNIIGYKELDLWLIYPLQALNLFEFVYVIYLSYQIGKINKTNTDKGMTIMMYSYVPAIILWVIVVMFFTIVDS